MAKLVGDPARVIVAESFEDAKRYKADHPEVAEWSSVSVPTLEYRMRGRRLQEFVLTPRVAARREAELIVRSCRFLVSLYGIADNVGNQAEHYEVLGELTRPLEDAK